MSTEAAATFELTSSLIPWEDNPRWNDGAVGAVAKSIERFGFASPIIARLEDRMVIAGHTRLKAALLLELKEVPVRFLDITRAEAEALALADNKLGELATWDDVKLGELLKGLEADAAGLGWTSKQLDDLFQGLEEAQPPDAFPGFDEDIETEHQCPKCGYEWSGASS